MQMRYFFIEGTAPITAAQWRHSLDQFAELLSDDMPLADTARRMSVTGGTACVLLARLKAQYGEQAL